MSKSKKFKVLTNPSDIQCGRSYIKVTVTDEKLVLIDVFKVVSNKYSHPLRNNFTDLSRSFVFNKVSLKENPHFQGFVFTNTFVSDTIGVYNGQRQSIRHWFYKDKGPYVCKSLFPFSNRLLQHIKQFENNPIAMLQFLNPERFFTADDELNIKLIFAQDNKRFTIKH